MLRECSSVIRFLPAVAVPAAVSFGLRLEPRKFAVIGQHPIRFELQKVFRIEFLRTFMIWKRGHVPSGRNLSHMKE